MSETTNLVVGLPRAGKTTFLAALWETIESGEIAESLRLGSMAQHDQTYLNRIRALWANCQPLPRTTMADEQTATLPFLDQNGDPRSLVFPDMSGETFENQWTTRQWSSSFAELVDKCAGCLLFLHPEHIREPVMIAQAIASNPLAAEGDDQPAPWDPAQSPSQVVLVDLMECIARRLTSSEPLRVAVVISAWDTVRPANQTPLHWLRSQLPLFHQYLRANPELFILEVFGVSALGGSLDTDRERLLNIDRPARRIRVISPEGESNDITVPVRWLLQGSES